MPIFSKTYSLYKSRQILRHAQRLFARKEKKLPVSVAEKIRSMLLALQVEIENKNREKAHALAVEIQQLSKTHLKKTPFEQARDFIFALAFALVVAVIVRQVWFEFYEIPTGSMRPTLKEQDRLVVSKTDFAINLPLTTRHLYFDPELVKRSGIFIFTGENMDIRDVDTLYFYLFPGKKQYVKRLMGKPGDTLYFYGGYIYGLDKDGNEITSLLQLPSLDLIEHIPFLNFEGKVTTTSTGSGIYAPVILHQMNEPIARLSLSSKGQPQAEMLPMMNSQTRVSDYGDLWGIKNFAMTRLLTKEQLKQLKLEEPADAPLYLELKHHPTIKNVTLGRDEYGRMRPLLGINTSIIPLQEKEIRTLFENLYTARFVVKNGIAMRYGHSGSSDFLPKLPGVPDGCYEFYYGKAYEVKWQGITTELPSSHPLCQFDLARMQLLFNLGMEFDLHFAPETKHPRLFPSRYAYFRAGDLFVMGAPLFKKEDPTLVDFLVREENKKSATYEPFKDFGPPLKNDGTLDRDLIAAYGLKIPDQMYLALGDNHAMSADSRDFGFVPQGNMRGAPSFIFWPPGNRWGTPNQPSYAFFNFPHMAVWGLALIILGSWYYFHQKQKAKVN